MSMALCVPLMTDPPRTFWAFIQDACAQRRTRRKLVLFGTLPSSTKSLSAISGTTDGCSSFGSFPELGPIGACSKSTGILLPRQELQRSLSGRAFLRSPSAEESAGRQDHTAWPSASGALVGRTTRVHRTPLPTSVTIAKRPSDRSGMRTNNHRILKNGRNLFCPAGLDKISDKTKSLVPTANLLGHSD